MTDSDEHIHFFSNICQHNSFKSDYVFFPFTFFTEKEAELLGGDYIGEDPKGGETTPAPAILTTGPSRTGTPMEVPPMIGEMGPEQTVDEIAKKDDMLEGELFKFKAKYN